jgi:hypothetical protein
VLQAGAMTDAEILKLAKGAVPIIMTGNLEGGKLGVGYEQALAVDSETPITWELESGTLPEGLTLSSEGLISGTPEAVGAYSFTLKAINANGSASKSFSIAVTDPAESKEYSLSFDGTLENALGNPVSVVTASANNPRSNTNTTPMEPEFVPGSKPGKEAIRLGYFSDTNGGTPTVNSLIDLGTDAFNYNQSFTLAYRMKIENARVPETNGWPAIFSNKNYSSGNNNGLAFVLKGGTANQVALNSKASSDSGRLGGSTDIRFYPIEDAKTDFVHIAAV